jgi:soluble lytic murein transglycosylase
MLAALVGEARAQSLQNKANEIRSAMESREFDRAESLVREVRARSGGAFAANNYDYLLGRLSERRGARAEAQALYQAVLNRNSVLAPYALWRLSLLARAVGDLTLERQYITRLSSAYPSSIPARTSRDRLIESLIESRNYSASISMLRASASPSGVRGRNAMAMLGDAYAKTGDAGSARSVFNQLISGGRDDYALAAAEGLDALDRAARTMPDEFESMRRARIYLFNRHWPEARAHMMSMVERFPGSPNRAEALYQTGFAYYREENYDEAIRWFERARAEFPSKKEGEQGFYWVGTALQKAQRYPEAARRYSEFIDAYPESDLVDSAYRNVVDSYRYAGKDAEALEWSRRIMDEYAGKPLAVVGLFNQARIELTRGNYETALALFTRLQAQAVTPKLVSSPARGEAAFLRIYTLERMGRLGEAARLYLAIPDDRENYFGQRATLRLRAMAKTEQGRRVVEPLARSYREQARAALAGGRYSEAKDAATQALRLAESADVQRELLQTLRASYSQLPSYNIAARYSLIPVARNAIGEGGPAVTDSSNQSIASELIFLGLYDEGVTPLRLAGFNGAQATGPAGDEDQPEANLQNVSPPPDAPRSEVRPRPTRVAYSPQRADASYSLAVYSNRGDQAQYAIAFAEPIFRSIPKDYRIDLMPRDLAELMYPAPYRDALNRHASRYEVDPRLVLALARQESRFNPAVKSGAAARGLLQFINETALKVAGEEGLKNFKLDDVYDPEIAVRLAVRYVSDLLALFPDNPYAVAASYNTGEQNVERWIFRARSNDVERLVAEIAIPETKDYLAKVMSNYRAYQQLYTRDLRPQR